MTANPALADDRVLPFQIEASALRGRILRMGPLLDEVLRHHAYPKPVAERLAEMLALAALLSGALKFEGVFTLQIKGDGPIKLMVADVTSAGHMRGYAQFDAAPVAALAAGPTPSVPKLFGAGYLALTVDQGVHTERYQGIVELTGSTLAECVHGYFRQSEQLEAAVMVTARAPTDGGLQGWRAGALMLQRLPVSGTEMALDDADEAWRRALILMSSCSAAELTSTELASEDVLFRLFHEDGVRVFRDHPLEARCRCSRERVERVLEALPRQDLDEMKVEGEVVVTCEFCSRVYRFGDAEIAALIKG
ncbi:MAG: Hsp33 family molecular chaperone HslO [Hypericibacter sp.]